MPAIINFLQQTGFYMFGQDGNGKCLIMIAISFILMYLAIVKGFEPLLLLPISFGMLCTNLPGADMFHEILFAGGHVHWDLFGGTPVTASFIAEMSESGVSDAVLAPYFQQLLASAQEAFGADTIQQVTSEVMAAAGGTISEFTAQAQAVAQAEQAAAVFQNVETVQEHSVAVARAETGDRVFQEIGCLVTGKEAECGADYGKQTFLPA